MKIEGLVGRTLRAQPSGVGAAMGMAGRAGFLRLYHSGWVVLPLGVRILDRMSNALLEGLDCHWVTLPVAREGESARALSELMQGDTQSYRHLPLRIATLAQDQGAVLMSSAERGGLARLAIAGAFPDDGELTAFLGQVNGNLKRLAAWAGVDVCAVAGVGGSSAAMAIRPDGGSRTLSCARCGSTHVWEAAPFAREPLPAGGDSALQRVHTPGASTIQVLAEMLGVGREQTLKALFLSTESGDLVFALVRGDLDASLEKLARVAGARCLRAASDSEIEAAGAIPGFASPIGLRVREAEDRDGVYVVADPSVYTGNDFAVGANASDDHFVHVDPRRDFSVTEVRDIALAPKGARCAECGTTLAEQCGTIVAMSAPLDAPWFSDESGGKKRAAAAWTCVDRLALFEQIVTGCADEAGIAWPPEIAPADVHVVGLKESEACLEVVQALEQGGLTVLFDDRSIGAGAKFADADLIGCPLRVTISSRSLQAGGAEIAGRRGTSPVVVPVGELSEHARTRLAALMST